MLGILRIAGDPGANGDITLRLEANETVVSIDTHTKNLTLIKSLDKEVINPHRFVVKRFSRSLLRVGGVVLLFHYHLLRLLLSNVSPPLG